MFRLQLLPTQCDPLDMTSTSRGLIVGLATVMMFGTVVVMQRLLIEEGIATEAAVGLRYLVGGLVCLGILAGLRRPVAPVRGERLRAFLLGALLYGMQAVLFYQALQHGTVATVSLLFYTYPALILIASLALGLRRWSWYAGAAALMSAVGAALVVVSGREVGIDPIGIALALGSACFVTVFLLINKRLLPLSPALSASAWVSFGVAASTLTVAVAQGQIHDISGRAAWLLLISGALTGLGTAGMYVALAALGPPRTAVLLSLQTVVAVSGSALVLGQPLLAGQLLGGALIISAIALGALSPHDTDAPEAIAEEG